MPSLPTGTVTFAFTDIEDSTALLRRLGDGYPEMLTAHRRIIRDRFGANGVEIDTQGDAFFFAFPRAREAVAAAADVQRAHVVHAWPHDAVVRVRIGLHTGEPHVAEEGYLGLDVVRAARICTSARGGQVLLSESTRALLGSALPDGLAVFPRGERHLKGIDEPERVYELAIEGVSEEHGQDGGETAEGAALGESSSSAPVPEHLPTTTEEAIERRFDALGKRLAEGIEEQVARRVERALERLETAPGSSREQDADVDDLAARSASLEEKILARVEAALSAGSELGQRAGESE